MRDAREQVLTVEVIKAMVAKAKAHGVSRPIRIEGTDFYLWHPVLGWIDPNKVT